MNKVAELAFSEMHTALAMPSPAESVFNGMNDAEKITVLRHAGIDRRGRGWWQSFSDEEQTNIITSIKRAADWARGLESKLRAAH